MHAAHDLTTPSRFFEFEMLASGRVLVRDQAVSAADARATGGILEDAFARHAHLAVACAKRVTGAQIAAHGVFVLHPKGFVRHGRGAPKDAERFDVEVDAVDHGVEAVQVPAGDRHDLDCGRYVGSRCYGRHDHAAIRDRVPASRVTKVLWASAAIAG